MKAAVLYEPQKLVIEEVPVPEIKAGEVLVKIKATAVCGTDIAIYKGKYSIPSYPVIQGHESVGIAEACGEGVKTVKPGDPVIINPALFCGKCHNCLNAMSNMCANGGHLGKDLSGTFVEYAAVPENSLTVMPAGIDFEDATSLQSLVSVLRGWERVSVRPGDTVAVIGMGAPGLLFSRLAVLAGAKVYSITRSKWKLDIAQRYGATPIGALDGDPVKTLMAATGGRGADLVVEAAGTEQTHAQAADMACQGGTLLLYAAIGSKGFSTRPVFFKELTVVGTRGMNRGGYERAVELYSAGKLDLAPLITHRFRLEDTAEMFDMVNDGRENVLRAVCVFD